MNITNLTKEQREKLEEEAIKSFPKIKERFLKVHKVKDEKEFTELYKKSAIQTKQAS